MVIISNKGYIIRNKGSTNRIYKNRGYDWFLVKAHNPSLGYIVIQRKMIYLPEELIGKRIRLKVEVIKQCSVHKTS